MSENLTLLLQGVIKSFLLLLYLKLSFIKFFSCTLSALPLSMVQKFNFFLFHVTVCFCFCYKTRMSSSTMAKIIMNHSKRKSPENDATEDEAGSSKRVKRPNGIHRSGPCSSIENHMVNGSFRNGFHPGRGDSMDVHTANESSVRAGKISKVLLNNFMCHKSLEIKFNHRINFMLGRNGSGKSAILTAVAIGLGGKATTTNRGSSVKEFIKLGENYGSVTVTLDNSGAFSYKPDVYGSEIIITRTLSKTGSMGYKVKNHRGQIVSSRKNDLQKIVTALNIQVDNPAVMLNQDASRSFLNTKDPHAKYALFIKATKIELITELYNEIQRNMQNLSVTITKKKQILHEMNEEVKDLEERWNRLQTVNTLRERCNELENELFWAAAVTEEKQLKTKERALNIEKARMEQITSDLHKILKREEALKAQERELQDQLKQLQTKANELEKAIGEATHEKNMKRIKYTDITNKLNAAKEKIRRHAANVREMEKEMEEMRRKSVGDTSYKERLQNEIVETRSKIESLEAVIITKTNDYKNYSHNIRLLEEESRSLNEEKRDNKMTQDRLKTEIAALQKNSSSMVTYGPWMPQVLKKIEEYHAKGRFVKKPVGPVGAYISLKVAEWAPVIESFLKASTLTMFCSHCAADRQILYQIFDQYVTGNFKPTVVTSTFFDKVHNISRNAVRDRRYSNMIDMLNITNPVVANCLIDQFQIETILLIPTLDEASKIMEDEHKVPLNCKRAITLKGDEMYPDPNYKMYAGNVQRARFLQVSTEDVLRSRKEELEKCKGNETELVNKMSEKQQERQQFEQETGKLKNIINNHKSQLQTLRVQLEKLQIEEPQVNSIEAFNDELKESAKRLETLQQEEESLKQEWEQCNEDMSEANKKCEECKKALNEERKLHEPLVKQLDTVKQETEEVLSGKRHRTARSETLQSKITNLEYDYTQQEEAVQKRISEAVKLCSRIDTDRSCEEITEELNRNRAYIAAVETDHGSREEIGEAYQRRSAARDKVSSFVKRVDKCLKSLKNSMAVRNQIFEDLCKNMKLRMKYMFQAVLDVRKYKGEIVFNDGKKTLDIVVATTGKVDPLASSTACLSGGERSFSTVAFITALWQVIETPFYFMDEFDVFMDKINRQVVMNLLLNHAKRRANSQFVFLTPLDTPNIADDGLVSLFRMDDPRP